MQTDDGDVQGACIGESRAVRDLLVAALLDGVQALRERSCGCLKIIEHQYRQQMKERRAERLSEIVNGNLRTH